MATLSLAGASHAAGFTNGSFESPGGAPIKQQLAEGETFVTGWISHGAGNYYESDGQDSLTASNGTHWVGFGHNGATGATLSQTFATFAGAFYTLNYDVRLQQGDEAGSGFKLSVSTGDSVLSGDASLAAWASGPALTFTGTGGDVTLTIQDVTTSGGVSNLALDNLSLSYIGGPTGAVPEPAAWAMMILGFGGVGGLMRRRRGLAAA